MFSAQKGLVPLRIFFCLHHPRLYHETLSQHEPQASSAHYNIESIIKVPLQRVLPSIVTFEYQQKVLCHRNGEQTKQRSSPPPQRLRPLLSSNYPQVELEMMADLD
jgi:abortive infection bacteriophage resistance protein